MVDESFEADQAAIDAMIGDFRGQRFLSPPPDPRLIDPTLLRALSARLADPYAYQWRATRANADLVDALYHTVTQANGSRYGLGIEKIALNDKGESPPVFVGRNGHARMLASDEFKLHYYVTACSMNVCAFISSYDEAVRLLGSLLPGCGFLLHCADGRVAVRLEKEGRAGPWVEASHAALALVLAALEHLERAPHEAAHWRSI
ncbi:hypothetical protein J2X36_005087 [Methylobacterium sp. BE186]|uniref:hypothetical protein n=1 Tax=Methylobacterium sp. BE186 TaxID=2817715 RepID=UPI00285913F3|nr:hypothetical protein [Methylobacterium sp. BE186]MDR7040305.1 hypothetical protein [Methylobacterium sp. BE186]